ncbi:hypothetical protein I7I48_04741 [Histoplasma ohiense]|nr:hypothetical protein I7I48_04741 [Histoplasma ohiense (nom. inval.)]
MSALPANPLSFLPMWDASGELWAWCGAVQEHRWRKFVPSQMETGLGKLRRYWMDCHWRQTMSAKHAGTGVLAVHKIGVVESVPMRDSQEKGASSALGIWIRVCVEL